jgi:hypothetical protein
MEFFLFLGIAFVGVVFFIWRSRARTSNDIDSQTKGLPDDLRDKNTGMVSQPNRGRPWGRGN